MSDLGHRRSKNIVFFGLTLQWHWSSQFAQFAQFARFRPIRPISSNFFRFALLPLLRHSVNEVEVLVLGISGTSTRTFECFCPKIGSGGPQKRHFRDLHSFCDRVRIATPPGGLSVSAVSLLIVAIWSLLPEPSEAYPV